MSQQYTLRPYQEQAAAAGTAFFREPPAERQKRGNALMVCPTGSGKSLILSSIADRLREPLLIFQPSKEILEQNAGKLMAYGFTPHVFSASCNSKEVGETGVTLATIGSAIRHPELFDHFRHICVDEAHAVNAKGGMYATFLARLEDAGVLGLSVGGESFIEMVGGPFGDGFVGNISDAFTLAAIESPPRIVGILEVIDLADVVARGWIGTGFGWKPCLRIMRHKAPAELRAIRARMPLSTTPSHSVYVATPGEEVFPRSGRHRHRVDIQCPAASNITAGDILMLDDGSGWSIRDEKPVDMVRFAAEHMVGSRIRVVIPTIDSVPTEVLRDHASRLVRSQHKTHAMVWRWRRSKALPISVYLDLQNPPPAHSLRLEGSKVSIAATVRMSDWAWMLGFYLGDGWLCKSDKNIGRIGFAVEKPLLEEFLSAAQSMKGVAWSTLVRQMGTSGAVEVRCSNFFLYRLLEVVCGRLRCQDKAIPGQWITSWSRQARTSLLEGLLASDGCEPKALRNRRPHVLTSTSRCLVMSAASLLRSLGVGALLYENSPRRGGTIGGRTIVGKKTRYDLHWSGYSQDGDNSGHKGIRRRLVHESLSFHEAVVRSNIADVSARDYVYDVEMDGHPSFVASGLLVHNTATPYRLASNSFGSCLRFLTRTRPRIFNRVIHVTQNGDLFAAGHLAKLEYYSIPGFDRSALRMNSTGNDFNDQSVQLYFAKTQFNQKLADIVRRVSAKRKNVLVFTRFVEEAQYLADTVPGTAIVSAETPAKERAALISGFRAGTIKAVANCGVLTTGFDYPELESVIVARPTMSLGLYYQMLGRAVRPHPGKVSAWIVDLCDNVRMFGHVEDLVLVRGEREKWHVESHGRQLTNVYYGKEKVQNLY